jgi:asparaginyl-tRNA synthetase
MRLNEDGKQFAPWTFFSWDRRNVEDHKEKSVLMFWSKNESLGIDEEELWYLDTRRFGSAVHSGFGLGFERLVLFVTGMTNIRDVIPSKNTIERRVLIFTKFSLRRINSLPEKLQTLRFF